ncbi:MAG: hypothetical protein AAGA22_02460 [Pseudomonadota bacterium]
MTIAVGLVSVVALIGAVVTLLRQLGASDAARALMLVTFLVFGGMVAFTYLPLVIG